MPVVVSNLVPKVQNYLVLGLMGKGRKQKQLLFLIKMEQQFLRKQHINNKMMMKKNF